TDRDVERGRRPHGDGVDPAEHGARDMGHERRHRVLGAGGGRDTRWGPAEPYGDGGGELRRGGWRHVCTLRLGLRGNRVRSGGGGRTVTRLTLQSTGPGTWDTDAGSAYWALGAAATLDGALLNNPTTMAVNFAVADGATFVLFASDYGGIEFAPGVTLTLTARFSDGTTATATTTMASSATMNLPYN